MKEIKGQYTTAKIFTDNIEETAVKQIENMVNSKMAENTIVRIMPDTHAGSGATIGTTMRLPENFEDWKVSPNIVGVDINCGVLMYKIKEKSIDFKKLDKVINKYVPSGFNVHNKAKDLEFTQSIINKLTFKIEDNSADRVHKSLGTLGGGNHFIELGLDEEGNYWLAVHSGSRNLGVQVAQHHQDIAIEKLTEANKVDIGSIIKQLKKENRESEIQTEIIKANEGKLELTNEEKKLATLSGKLLKDYLIDMELAQSYGERNREVILNIIIEHMSFEVIDNFNSSHNFIEHVNLTNGIIRKGATSANKDERLVIPLNMRDGSLICVGKGNSDWNYSAPHGAGRLMSRTKAREQLTLDDFKNQMKNVYSTSVLEETLDEAPDAYKPAEEIIGYIRDTVDIVHLVRPVYNYKAH